MFSLSFCLFLTFAYIFCRFPIGSRIADKEIAPPSTKSKFFLTGYKTEQIIAIYSCIYIVLLSEYTYTIWISISIAITNDNDSTTFTWVFFSSQQGRDVAFSLWATWFFFGGRSVWGGQLVSRTRPLFTWKKQHTQNNMCIILEIYSYYIYQVFVMENWKMSLTNSWICSTYFSWFSCRFSFVFLLFFSSVYSCCCFHRRILICPPDATDPTMYDQLTKLKLNICISVFE